MHTTLDILEVPCPEHPAPTQPLSTTIGTAGYEGFWAASVTWGEVVEVDRIAANPINRRDPSGLASYYGTFDIDLQLVEDSSGAWFQGYKITYTSDPAHKLCPGHSIILVAAIAKADGSNAHIDIGLDPSIMAAHLADPTMKPPSVWAVKGLADQPGPTYWYTDAPNYNAKVIVMAVDHVVGADPDWVIGSLCFDWDPGKYKLTPELGGPLSGIGATASFGANSAGSVGVAAFFQWWRTDLKK